MLFDLYNILFKEHIEVISFSKKEVSQNNYIKSLVINKILQSNILKKIKKYTVLNEQNSYLFISNLLNSMGPFSMWGDEEDEGFEEVEELIDSVNQLTEEANKQFPNENKSNKGNPQNTNQTNNDPQKINNNYQNITDKISDFINRNFSWLQDSNHFGSLPKPDRVKNINMLYNINRLANNLGKLKKRWINLTINNNCSQIQKYLIN